MTCPVCHLMPTDAAFLGTCSKQCEQVNHCEHFWIYEGGKVACVKCCSDKR